MFSAFNYRNVAIGIVGVGSYRDYCNRNGVTFMSGHTRGSDREGSSGLMFLIITLGSILFILLMIPSLIEPPVLYIGVVFTLLTLIFIIGFTNSYLKNKNSDTSNNTNNNISIAVDRRFSYDSNNFSNLISCDPNDGQNNNNNNNGSQLSMSESSSDLPPKYESPPSYSHTIYSINI